ncbi:cytosine permease [Sporanaerobium hydrogeniformans]|uniref:Cytosine permease n=1 Tax=Sporanaerobium hydrogeniformans TaxID=3072179 RepID=A0AC61DB52_9FIRM|nr:cytosine permease [Sporanaerobium hydrogeniformans]PHV69988.1 cytosine permease [Sporanaerobium hydrogeniformans]
MSEANKNTFETTTLEAVPLSERKSWINVAYIQAGIMICVPSLMLGGILAEGMSISKAIWAGIVGYTLVTILFCLIGIIGSDLGVPTCIVACSAFGKKGARFIVSTLLMLSMIGWFAVQTSVCGSAFSNLLKEFTGINFSQEFSMLIWGLIMLITAVYGINALEKLNKLAVPALFVVTIIGCFMALKSYGTANLFVNPAEETMSFIDGIVLTVSFMAAGALCAPDFTRYQKTRKDTILSSSIGVMPAGILMLIMGAVMTRIASEYDITLVFCQIGIPIMGMLVLIIATWTTNTTNAYSAGLDAVSIFNLKENKRALATMLAGVIGTLAAVIGMATHFEAFLYILGDILLPIMGIFLADYWVLAKGKAASYNVRTNWNWNGNGLVAWICGVLTIKCIPVGIPFIQGIAVAFIVFIVMSKTVGTKTYEALTK